MLERSIYLMGFFLLAISSIKGNSEQGLAIDNFVLTDINGQKYELDQMILEGKHVILNFSTTWAPSSWAYEKTEALSNVKKLNALSGKNDLVILFLEADLNTDLNCIKGNENCSYSSMGDWTSLIDYPIIDLTEEELNLLSKYQIDEYPTVYGIKPDRKISSLGQADMKRLLGWLDGEVIAYEELPPIKSSINFVTSQVNNEIYKIVTLDTTKTIEKSDQPTHSEGIVEKYSYSNKFIEEIHFSHYTKYYFLSLLVEVEIDTYSKPICLSD